MKWKTLPGLLLVLCFNGAVLSATESKLFPDDVCPPFNLRDEQGNIIDPVNGINADKPYSPRQTCGKCHDYEKITQGYHFTQGAGEEPTETQKERCQWALTPGNYGGTWCSPAPLYRYLSPKQNNSPATMDMTSFTFITAGCGACHPGGGSAELDRNGNRYDHWMSNPQSGFVSGGENNFDGDYYKARWSETGVLEADCFICHLPEYNFKQRNNQISLLNFRWAATAGSGLAQVEGSIDKGTLVTVKYDIGRFDPEGKLSPHIVKEPRNEACLNCHDKPGYKKRGANFRSRTDVHIRSGMRCVDCHPAGSSASDQRINGKEEHQIAKGDDPGGQVRNDLDNTCKDCADCHTTGDRGAPLARHQGLPPVHLDRISCQACHIPERLVKSAQVQAGDVFNPGTKIPTKGKHLWTFYGPDMKYWNHYGDLEMMGYDDKPTFAFKPDLAKYKGMIYPVNRIHSSWPAIETEGEPGFMQPKMGDVYKMWTEHRADSTKYSSLAVISDDNGDMVPEVNRPEEIEALIESVGGMLNKTGYPMEGKRVVWVMDDRAYSTGEEYRQLSKEEWETSPYANVHKYSHDVYPAESALGSNGCSDCHSRNSDFFFAANVKYPFDSEANQVVEPQYKAMGYSGKPNIENDLAKSTGSFFRWLTVIVLAGLFLHLVLDMTARIRTGKTLKVENEVEKQTVQRFNSHFLAQHLLLAASVLLLILSAIFLWGLRYPGAEWAASLTSILGGIDSWRVVHRAGALVLLFTCAYHLVYIIVHPEGRRDFYQMLPRWKDFKDLGNNLLWFFGRKEHPPRFGRFTYFEKFDYWAVFWGCVIMAGTGLAMWFPEMIRLLVPSASAALFEAFKEAHAHEALLAALALFIWHFYNVHLRPGRFPGTLFWVHGRITVGEAASEHPLEIEKQNSK